MPKTITVQGNAKISTPVDLVEISVTISNTDTDYTKACGLTENEFCKLKNSITRAGFDISSLKTKSYNVRTDYKNIHSPDGTYTREFSGFTCAHSLKLTFSFANELLSKAVSAILGSLCKPEMDISFTVSDKERIKNELLILATKSANEKAQILCNASGAKLGTLLSITYSDHTPNLYSQSAYNLLGDGQVAKAYNVQSFNPDDIISEDTVTFVWEIQ